MVASWCPIANDSGSFRPMASAWLGLPESGVSADISPYLCTREQICATVCWPFYGHPWPWHRRMRERLGFFGAAGSSEQGSRWAWRDAAAVGCCGGACHAGEPRALAAAMRRAAAQLQIAATGHPDAIAILMRRTLMRTSAPILSSLRRIVPQLALANGVQCSPIRRTAQSRM